MIIDRMPLADRAAYLRDKDEINLAQSPNHFGSSDKLVEGQAYEVNALSLYIEAEDLYRLLPREDDKPLIQIKVIKEMFPSLYADPHANRVHSVAGFEDFQRGERKGLRAMEVDGIATLVAVGTEPSSWVSPIYRMPHNMTLSQASWDLAVSRFTAEDVFDYQLGLEVWLAGQDVESVHGGMVPLAAVGSKPDRPRFNDQLVFESGEAVKDAIAYRVHFLAQVHHDTQLEERQVGHAREESIGSPLLRAIHLLEPTPSSLSFVSLHELTAAALEYDFLDSPRASRLRASLDLTATLRVGEQVTLAVRKDVFKRLEAWLDGEVRLRPPAIEKEIV